VISSEVRETARQDVAFPTVLQDPDAYKGETVIWGGLIIDTVNRQDGTTLMVLETPLDSEGLPQNAETSRGRFMAVTASYLDNEVYRKGRKVTLAGEVLGKELQPLGQTHYAYPLLSVRELHLWREEYRPYGYFYGPYSWGPYWWYWDWWWPHRRYRHW
jgi:outer membrane lipoprotein